MRSPLLSAIDAGVPLHLAPDEALAHFDSLPAYDERDLRGQWRGREVYTDHPLDGVLSKVAWYGKQFDDAERVHPLLVRDSGGVVYPMNPRLIRMPMLTNPPPAPDILSDIAPKLMWLMRPAVRTSTPGARLDTVDYRGVPTVAMHYLDKPVTDVFRKLNDDTVLGLMDYRGMPRPYFFVLRRVC